MFYFSHSHLVKVLVTVINSVNVWDSPAIENFSLHLKPIDLFLCLYAKLEECIITFNELVNIL